MNRKRRVELLAPAGNLEAFLGAIHAGADAVYLGGSQFGARAYAENFTTEELVYCIRYAHIHGRKVYLTVNTLVKESEFDQLYDYLCPYYEAGLDGVIIQDIGVFTYIRDQFPNMELHVSTQMTLTDIHGAKMLRDMGACRIVPARELSLEEIKRIKATGLDIECFIHGAMCYCYSGQCLFSSILGGRSGNRGRCAQPCRLPYQTKVEGKVSQECYPLSLKDMCTIEHIPELIEAGIDSFKIEGRMKKPEYAAGVTAIYRKYIDLYYEGRFNGISKKDLEALSALYIRSERQDGYYYKHNGKDMVTLSSPAYSGSDEEQLLRIRQRYLEEPLKLPISVYGHFQAGEPAMVTFLCGEQSVTVQGDAVQEAQKQPITEENVRKQLNKLGDSAFVAEEMDVYLSDNAFYPLKAINELRREAVRQLEEALIAEHGLYISRPSVARIQEATSEPVSKGQKHTGLTLSVQSMEQLKALDKWLCKEERNPFTRLYVHGDLLVKEKAFVTDLCAKWAESCELVASLPPIIRKRDEQYLEALYAILADSTLFAGVLVRSYDGMGWLLSKQYQGKIYADYGFYIWNRHALSYWSQYLQGFCMPLELKTKEQLALTDSDMECEKVVFGRIPMMITANCVAQTTYGCRKGTATNQVELIDRYQKQFPVALNCTHCMNTIYNSVPLSLHNDLDKLQQRFICRLDLTIEDEQATYAILDCFVSCMLGDGSVALPFAEYTTGHEKRGVE